MILHSEIEVVNTREKLQQLETRYRALAARIDDDDEELREMSMESLMRLINQLKEEIARYEAHHAVRR
ncbi:MAG: hypothetical protein SH850_12435 [Planctomycetaceae bacterium]|nr:hypothetical protein [Planctomycetaceae bacterium]